MSLTPGAEVVLAAEKPAAGGRMIARHEGQVVLVAGAIPGERVRARVERVSKQLAFAEATEVLDASPDRRSAAIDWACGGSLYAHIEYPRQLVLKAAVVSDAFARIGKVTLSAPVGVTGSPEDGYRMRAKLHARDGRFGFFREGTHELCDPAATRQLLPAAIEALHRLEGTLDGGITQVTSCELSENAAADERAVLLAMDDSRTAPLCVDRIEGITGLLFTGRDSSRLTVGYGSPFVLDRLAISHGTVELTHHVQSFFQGNRYLLPRLVERVLAHVPDGGVIDLYAGVGLFSVSLAARGRKGIVAVEGDRSSARDLEANAARYPGAVAVEHMPVETYLQRRRGKRPDAVVLDPPRTGMSRDAISGVLAIKAPQIVYVSCDVATVARDVKRFMDDGYSLDHIEAFDLFPNTAHVETLAVLTCST